VQVFRDQEGPVLSSDLSLGCKDNQYNPTDFCLVFFGQSQKDAGLQPIRNKMQFFSELATV
jgi:hypothetical protein